MTKAGRSTQLFGDEDDLERWRLAGLLLARLNPDVFEFLLLAAEVGVAQAPEVTEKINSADFLA